MSKTKAGLNTCPSCNEWVDPKDFFCNTCGTPLTSPNRPRTKEVRGYVQIIGTVEIVFGIISLFIGVLLGLVGNFLLPYITIDTGSLPSGVVSELIRIFATFLGLVIVLLALFAILSGARLMQYKNSGRMGTMIIGAFALFAVPFGTIFGIAALYVLTRPEAEPLFS